MNRYTIFSKNSASIFSCEQDDNGMFCKYSEVIKEIERLNSKISEYKNVYPEKCPITGRDFFMVLEHPSLGPVATYGGPFDSYTIPEWNRYDSEFRSERYDHDGGYWVDGGEPYPFFLIDESEYIQIIGENEELKKHGKRCSNCQKFKSCNVCTGWVGNVLCKKKGGV